MLKISFVSLYWIKVLFASFVKHVFSIRQLDKHGEFSRSTKQLFIPANKIMLFFPNTTIHITICVVLLPIFRSTHTNPIPEKNEYFLHKKLREAG